MPSDRRRLTSHAGHEERFDSEFSPVRNEGLSVQDTSAITRFEDMSAIGGII